MSHHITGMSQLEISGVNEFAVPDVDNIKYVYYHEHGHIGKVIQLVNRGFY